MFSRKKYTRIIILYILIIFSASALILDPVIIYEKKLRLTMQRQMTDSATPYPSAATQLSLVHLTTMTAGLIQGLRIYSIGIWTGRTIGAD